MQNPSPQLKTHCILPDPRRVRLRHGGARGPIGADFVRRGQMGMVFAREHGVRIAVPICDGRVSPVLDTAVRLLVVHRRRGEEVERRESLLGPLPLETLVQSILELGVDVVLCAAVSEPLRHALERRGVRLEMHLCGEVDALLAAFCGGRWRRADFRMPGCWRQAGRGHRCFCERSLVQSQTEVHSRPARGKRTRVKSVRPQKSAHPKP